jgi:hypothetical protein
MYVNVRVAGIPAIADITSARKTKGDPTAWTCPDDFYGSQEMEFTLRDRKGYPAPWLERKAEELGIWDEIEIQAWEKLEEMKDDV